MKNYELAYEDYKSGMKYKDIAEKYDVSINTVKSWKSRKWGAPPKEKVAHKKEKVCTQEELQPVIVNEELTDKQQLFCLLYFEYRFNATKAYKEAFGSKYSTAMTEGSKLLRNPKIKKELTRLKAELQNEIHVSIKDIVHEYINQSFADITDFTEFGYNDVGIVDATTGEPILDEETGEPKVYKQSFVAIKSSDEVDGRLIQEVKKGKDGVSVKLYDKHKAMSELMKYLNTEGDDGDDGIVIVDSWSDADEEE